MKRLFLSVFISCAFISAKAQEEFSASSLFAVVVDKDGYVNVRDNNKKIIDKLDSGSLVYCFEGDGDWIDCDFSNGDEASKSGLIHKSRLAQLSTFPKIPIVKSQDNKVILKRETIEIIIKAKAFTKSGRKITSKGHYDNQINGKWIWGTDGALPKEEYESIDIKMNGIEFYLPENAINDLFNPNIEYTSAHYDNKNDVLYICTLNGDGAGGYFVAWVIDGGKYKGRILGHGF